jgi:hypothetical protein
VSERPDDDTIRLLRETLEEIATNEAVQSSGPIFRIKIRAAGGVMETTLTEPPIKLLRPLLDRLRHLDMRSSDIRLDRVFPILERMPLKEDWRGELGRKKAAYRHAQLVSDNHVQEPGEPPAELLDHEPTWIKPREAFRLWAYGGVVHSEYAKEQKWARLGIAQGMVRLMGHQYAVMLLDEADFLLGLLRFGIE